MKIRVAVYNGEPQALYCKSHRDFPPTYLSFQTYVYEKRLMTIL